MYILDKPWYICWIVVIACLFKVTLSANSLWNKFRLISAYMADSMHGSFELTQQHACNRSLRKKENILLCLDSDVSSFVRFVAHAVNEFCADVIFLH